MYLLLLFFKITKKHICSLKKGLALSVTVHLVGSGRPVGRWPIKLEEATRELLKLQAKFENELTDQEKRARWENIRIHGIEEGLESNSTSMITFVEKLLREKLELPQPMT